jgi:hypothetical protein
MAKLPMDLVDRATLANMRVGQTCFTLPWAMWVDLDMECWLHPDYPAHDVSYGSARMLVRHQADGYHVCPPSGAAYRPSEIHGYASEDDTRWLPVVSVEPIS